MMSMHGSIHDWTEWAQASIEWSERRREKARQYRRGQRVLGALAVIGLVLAIYYVTLPYPYEQWWIGLLAVGLMTPYLARRFS